MTSYSYGMKLITFSLIFCSAILASSKEVTTKQLKVQIFRQSTLTVKNSNGKPSAFKFDPSWRVNFKRMQEEELKKGIRKV